MLFTHEPLKRDLRNARRVLWWSLVIDLFLGAFSGFGFSYGLFVLITSLASVLALLFSYLNFLGFSRLAKHFHSMRLFWFFVATFIVNVFISMIEVVDKVIYYEQYDPYHTALMGLGSLTGATFVFVYGYLIMDLPEKKFGKLLFQARLWNIGLALVTPFMVYLSVADPKNGMLLLAWLADITLIIITTAIDYKILGKALTLVGGVLPRPAPTPN